MINEKTATDIALIYREIKASEDLLSEIQQAQSAFNPKDIRDVFGRIQGNIEVGIPMGESSKRIFRMQWKSSLQGYGGNYDNSSGATTPTNVCNLL